MTAKSTSLPLRDLAEVLTPQRGRAYARFHLCADPSITDDEATAWLSAEDAHDLFLAAFAKMVAALSEPDPPAVEGYDRPTDATRYAMWEFDDYRWRLWVAVREAGHAVVMLEYKTPSHGPQ